MVLVAEITVRLLVALGAMAAVVGAATLVAMEETVALAEVRTISQPLCNFTSIIF